jgi:hypothetical protein
MNTMRRRNGRKPQKHGGDRQVSESETCPTSWRDVFSNPREIHEARELRDAEQVEPGTSG